MTIMSFKIKDTISFLIGKTGLAVVAKPVLPIKKLMVFMKIKLQMRILFIIFTATKIFD